MDKFVGIDLMQKSLEAIQLLNSSEKSSRDEDKPSALKPITEEFITGKTSKELGLTKSDFSRDTEDGEFNYLLQQEDNSVELKPQKSGEKTP
jgi:hypothetical protein